MALVFQYGSNCSDEQMNSDDRLRGDAVFSGIAETLGDYRLAFDVWSSRRRCAAADLVASPGEKVWGVLYEVPDWLISRGSADARGRRSFDAIEGEGRNYRREKISVRTQDGEIVSAITYVVISPDQTLQTNLEYVGHIVRGLRERGVTCDYIARVKEIATSNRPDLSVSIAKL